MCAFIWQDTARLEVFYSYYSGVLGSPRLIFGEGDLGFEILGISGFLLIWAKRTIDSAWLRDSRIALSECLAFYRHIPSGKKKSGWKFLFFHREKVFSKNIFSKIFEKFTQKIKIPKMDRNFQEFENFQKFVFGNFEIFENFEDFFWKTFSRWQNIFFHPDFFLPLGMCL